MTWAISHVFQRLKLVNGTDWTQNWVNCWASFTEKVVPDDKQSPGDATKPGAPWKIHKYLRRPPKTLEAAEKVTMRWMRCGLGTIRSLKQNWSESSQDVNSWHLVSCEEIPLHERALQIFLEGAVLAYSINKPNLVQSSVFMTWSFGVSLRLQTKKTIASEAAEAMATRTWLLSSECEKRRWDVWNPPTVIAGISPVPSSVPW